MLSSNSLWKPLLNSSIIIIHSLFIECKNDGNNSIFKVLHNGQLVSLSAQFLYSGFSINDDTNKSVFWFGEDKSPHVLTEDNQVSNFVMSSETEKIICKINNENKNLEIWVNEELYATFPKGYVGVIDNG